MRQEVEYDYLDFLKQDIDRLELRYQTFDQEEQVRVDYYKPLPISFLEKQLIKERQKKFNQAQNAKKPVFKDRNPQQEKNQLYQCLKSSHHSSKLNIGKKDIFNEQGIPEFAYKVVYRRGNGFKPQDGMSFQIVFQIKGINGKKFYSSWERITPNARVGRKRTDGLDIIQFLSRNVTEGEIGSLFVTPYYGFGKQGNWDIEFSPNGSLRIDYHIKLLTYKEPWEENEKQKAEDILAALNEVQKFHKQFKQNQKKRSFQEMKEDFYRNLYIVRRCKCDLKQFPKGLYPDLIHLACVVEVKLLVAMQMKISALRELDRFFSLLKQHPAQQEVESSAINQRISLCIEFGIYNRLYDEIQIPYIGDQRQKFYDNKILQGIHQAETQLYKFQIKNFELKKKQLNLFKKKLKANLEIDLQREPKQIWTYDLLGYKPTREQKYQLDKKMSDQELLKYVFGEHLQYYLEKMEAGLKTRQEYRRNKNYVTDEKLFYQIKKNNEQFFKQLKIKNPSKSQFVDRKENQSWEEYYERCRVTLLPDRLIQCNRKPGENYKTWLKRKKKQQKHQYYQSETINYLKERLMKLNKKIITLPPEEACKIFQLD